METLKDLLDKNKACSYDLYVDEQEDVLSLNLDMFDAAGDYIDSHTLIYFDLSDEKNRKKLKDKVLRKLYSLKDSLEGLICPLEVYVVGFLDSDEQGNPHAVISNRYYLTREDAIKAMKVTVKEKTDTGVRYSLSTFEVNRLTDDCAEYVFSKNVLPEDNRFVLKRVKLLKR